MAADKKRRYAYGHNAVNGSLAYDYDNPALYPEYEYGKPLDIPARPKVREEVVADTSALTRQSISPVAILGFALAAVLLVCTNWVPVVKKWHPIVFIGISALVGVLLKF